MAVTPTMQVRLEVMLSYEQNQRPYACSACGTNLALERRELVTRTPWGTIGKLFHWHLTEAGREQARND